MSTTPPYRCPTCKSTSGSRNLAVFIDGTSNKPGDKNTNVVKLYAQVKEEGTEPERCKLYLEGIGTHPENLPPLYLVGREIYSWFEMALAWNVEINVKKAYTWLVENYQRGNQIYLFGFSRGAYQVRVLASMIHEVGLVKEKENINSAYDHYLSIHPHKPNTREKAQKFKKDFCRSGVRVHFVGVWDTVSSIGLVKTDIFVSASAAVTNSCHFRHSLALDERRVKFMPEYFVEMNVHHGNVRTPITANTDIEEVWFAGSHSDVGGTSRPDSEQHFPEPADHSNHPGNISLQWMKREAAAQGLIFTPQRIFWDPHDVDFGTTNSMTSSWRMLEILPIRHQVSFSGSGKHEHRWHRFRPRRVIPGHQIHHSVLSGEIYTPRATLGKGIDIPAVPCGGLWTTEFPDEMTTDFLRASLDDRLESLGSQEKVICLLDHWLQDNRQIPVISSPRWTEASVRGNFAHIIIYYVTSGFSISEELVKNARDSIEAILSRCNQMEDRDALIALRFIARHPTLRRCFVSSDVARAAVRAVELTVQEPNNPLFPPIMDTLSYLVQDDDLRGNMIHALTRSPSDAGAEKTTLSLALEVKPISHLMAALKLIESSAKYLPDVRSTEPLERLRGKITDLAVRSKGPVGSAAVKALVALKVPLPHNTPFPNILGYLANILPRLDVEGGGKSSPNASADLPPVLRVDGSGGLNEEMLRKLVSAVKSRDAHHRAAATLVLVNICRHPAIRTYLSDNNFMDVLMKQMGEKKASLMAAYALNACLRYPDDMPMDHSRAAKLIFTMLNNGCFDDAVGRVEGFTIFQDLMNSDDLRLKVLDLGLVDALVKKLEGGDHNDVRVALICLNNLGMANLETLKSVVNQSLTALTNRSEKVQKRGVKVLSALAQTGKEAGEEAIRPHVIEIVKMLPPHSKLPRSQLFGPAAALYDLSKNETLRDQIRKSNEFEKFKKFRHLQRRATTLNKE